MLRIRQYPLRSIGKVRYFVKPGDKVPINYIKGKVRLNLPVHVSLISMVDKEAPVIKKDEEYPPWVMKLTDKVKIP